MHRIFLYQIFIIIIAIVAILLVFGLFNRKKISAKTFILWIFLWIIIGIFSFLPDLSGYLANFFGIGRGLDFIFLAAIFFLFYLIFRLYLKIEDMDNEISILVRKIAIENEEKMNQDKKKD